MIPRISDYTYVIRLLVKQMLIVRFRKTILGYLWTLITPLLMMTVLAVIFSGLFNQDIKTFTIFLFAGFIPWNFFSNTVITCSGSMIANEGLIKKIYLPKIIFPLSISIALLIDAVYAFIALFIIMILLGANLSLSLISIPFSYLLLFSFSLGIGLILSVYSVFLRDIQHITPIIIQALFFLSPILYPSDRFASGPLGFIINLNPVVPFIDLFRNPLYHSSFPSLETYILASIFSITALITGLFVMDRYKREISFKL